MPLTWCYTTSTNSRKVGAKGAPGLRACGGRKGFWSVDSGFLLPPLRPTSAVTNPCDRKKCEWLCLLSPSGPVCTCPNGKRLDNGTCVAVPSPTPPPDGKHGCAGAEPPEAPNFPPVTLTPQVPNWPHCSSPQRLSLEPVTCNALMAVAASSMPAGSPSAAASPATPVTSVSWTSAGSTVATGAPVLPPPLVWFSCQDFLAPPH